MTPRQIAAYIACIVEHRFVTFSCLIVLIWSFADATYPMVAQSLVHCFLTHEVLLLSVLVSLLQAQAESLPLSFFVEGEQMKLLEKGPSSVNVTCPVRIFHGMKDSIVPYSCSTKLLECLASTDVHATLIKVHSPYIAYPWQEFDEFWQRNHQASIHGINAC